MKKISRRKFLQATAATAALASAAAQGPSGAILERSNRISANHWGAFYVNVRGGRMVGVTPYVKDAYPTPMLEAMADRVYAQNRIQYPMVRASYLRDGPGADPTLRGAEPFVRVSWREAFDLVAKELNRVKKEFGPASIFAGSYGWYDAGQINNPPVLLQRMLRLHGGFVGGSGDYSTAAGQVIMPHVVGTLEVYEQQTAWPVILDSTQLIVLWGADPLLNCQIGWAPADHYAYGAIEELKKRRGRIEVVSIDPRVTDTARYLDARWIAPRPGTDTALMLGIAHALYSEKRHDQAFLDKYTVGFARFAEYLTGKSDGTPKTPEWAANISGVEASVIRNLARQMAAKRTMLMGGWAIQRQHHGEQAHWMLVTLAAMLGQIGLPGGGFGLSYHYDSGGNLTANAPGLPGITSGAASGGAAWLSKDANAIPVARVADMLLNPGQPFDFNGKRQTYPDIKLVYWAGGNPFVHHQDRNRLIQAWQKPQTVIVQDPFWTPTAKFADIVLPASTTFERDDIAQVGSYSRVRIVAMKKAVEPLYESRSDFEIFAELSRRLGFGPKFTEGRDTLGWVRFVYGEARKQAAQLKLPMPDFDTFWNGTGVVEFPIPGESRSFVRYGDFRKDPILNALGTPSGKIEIYSKTIEGFKYDDCPPHPTWLEPAERLGSEKARQYPLHLSSPHPKYRLHSQLNNTWIRRWYEVHEREPVWINPVDAEARGIRNGDVVRLFNERGQTLAGAVVTDRVRRGVVVMAEGAWYDPAEPGKVGALCKHGDVNVLTIDRGTSKLAQGNIAHTALVQLEKFGGELPEVTAFDPPKSAERG